MSELNDQAIRQADEAVSDVNKHGVAAAPEALVKATAAQAIATAALVQATEAQTKAIEYQGQLMKGARR